MKLHIIQVEIHVFHELECLFKVIRCQDMRYGVVQQETCEYICKVTIGELL